MGVDGQTVRNQFRLLRKSPVILLGIPLVGILLLAKYVYQPLLAVKEGEMVTKGDNERRATILYTWDPYNDPSIIKTDGELRWKDLVPGVTLKEELARAGAAIAAASAGPSRAGRSRSDQREGGEH